MTVGNLNSNSASVCNKVGLKATGVLFFFLVYIYTTILVDWFNAEATGAVSFVP